MLTEPTRTRARGAVVSDAAVEALRSGTKVPVTLRDKPDLYDKEG